MERIGSTIGSFRPRRSLEGMFATNFVESPRSTPAECGHILYSNGGSPLLRKNSGFSTGSAAAEEAKEDTKRHKRKEQNRTAQRAYRERKVQRIVELEAEIERLVEQVSGLENNNRHLETEIRRLRAENDDIRSSLTSTAASSPASTGGNDAQPRHPRGKGIPLKDCLMVYGGIYDSSIG